ncbi:MAG: non-canonical purine NTP pyrophosphatase [Bacilli bacterium]|nr:non-canonical purine NTP pyrophosphatase [Bacilli bacterium]
MKKITYVTGNWAKIASAKQYLEPLGYEIDNIKIETPEIQSDDVTEVAKYSAKWAANELNIPVIKNDTGFFIKHYNGFPGAYMKYMDETLKVDGLLKLMEGVEDRSAYLKETIAYCEPGGEPIVFEGKTEGTIAYESSGEYGWGIIDHVFIPKGENKTLGNFPDEERWNFWSVQAYLDLAKYLDDKDKTFMK